MHRTHLTHLITVAALLVAAPAAAHAQDMYTNAVRKAQNAAAAANAHIDAEQQTRGAERGARDAAKNPVAPASPSNGVSRDPRSAGRVPSQGHLKLELPSADTATPPSTLMRELFEYPLDGRRDPFVSLLTTNELRPAMSDLRLTGILYDHSGTRSVATLRDLGTNAQYRVTVGSILGRMHVAAIRVKTIVFTIDEFGTTRQDSLVLGDSTKARVR
jgi:hypothetical protein